MEELKNSKEYEKNDIVDLLRIIYKSRQFLKIILVTSAVISIITYFIIGSEKEVKEVKKTYSLNFQYTEPLLTEINQLHLFERNKFQLIYFVEKVNSELKDKHDKKVKKLEEGNKGEPIQFKLKKNSDRGGYNIVGADKKELEEAFKRLKELLLIQGYREETLKSFTSELAGEKEAGEKEAEDSNKKLTYSIFLFIMINFISIIIVFIKDEIKNFDWNRIKDN